MTPEVLAPYDAVVTIGKTVQYALSMGIPAYVYDHFGGVGWLDEDSLEPELHWAFSGQRTDRGDELLLDEDASLRVVGDLVAGESFTLELDRLRLEEEGPAIVDALVDQGSSRIDA